MISCNYLERLNKVETINDLIEVIKKIFVEFEEEEYIPALIEQGNFTVEVGEDFYLKLVLKHHDVPIDTTWLKENLSFGLSEPGDKYDAFIHNLIVYRKYKSRNIYQLNPIIGQDSVNEFQYENSMYVNSYYNTEYSNLIGKPVLKNTKEIKLLLLKDVLKYCINDPDNNEYPKYELVAEFEYRKHNFEHKNIVDKEEKFPDSYIRIDINNNRLYVLGSVLIPFKYTDNKGKVRDIIVLDMITQKQRKHNAKNYNGDIDEGFIYFTKDIIPIIRKYYYIYDLQMYDKKHIHDINNRYLIDILDDKVMFFEGEYNKLPNEVKNEIDKYNFMPKQKKNMISKAMSLWQLEANWNWEEKLLPNCKLANLIKRKSFDRAIDLSLSFECPLNIDEFKKFIIKIEQLTKIKLEEFNKDKTDVSLLISIRNQGYINKEIDIDVLFQKYCYSIWRKYND